MYGTITMYKPERGFGFIRHSSGDEDTFFHISDYQHETEPQVGLTVEFRIGKRKGRPLALEVRPLGEAHAILGAGGAA